jgi:flagellar biogenesis protein FliO
MPANAPPEFRAQFESMMSAMQVVSVIFALAFCGLFGWIIWRLMSADVRREFAAGA